MFSRTDTIHAVLAALIGGSSCGPAQVQYVTTVDSARAQKSIDNCLKTAGKADCQQLCLDLFEHTPGMHDCSFERRGDQVDVWYDADKEEPEPVNGCAGGRRPAGLARRACAAPSHAAAYLGYTAQLEAASVTAFARVHQQLTALGASPNLLSRVRSPLADEIAHAEAMIALARRYGAEPLPPSIEHVELTALDQAIENIVEGAIGEAVAALHAAHAAVHAFDPVVRATFARLAAGATPHALRAYDLVPICALRFD